MRHLRGPYPPMTPGRTRRSRRKHPSKNNQDDNTRPLATHGSSANGRYSDGTTSTATTTNRHAAPLRRRLSERPQPQPYRRPENTCQQARDRRPDTIETWPALEPPWVSSWVYRLADGPLQNRHAHRTMHVQRFIAV